MDLDAWQWLVVLGVTFLGALLQGTIGFGYAVLSVPILALLDPRLVPVPQMISALPLTLYAAWRERTHTDLRQTVWILLGRIPGVVLGMGLLLIATQQMLDVFIASVVLLGVGILSTPIRLRRSPLVDLAIGTFSTMTGYVSAIGGPPVALLLRDARGPELRSTLGAVFAVGVVITLSVRAVSHQMSRLDLRLGALLVPIVVLAMLLSRRLHPWVEGKLLSRAVLATSALAAIGLLLRAL